MRSRITYECPGYQPPVTIELGYRHRDFESQGHVAIQRYLAIDCPLLLTALVLRDGRVVEGTPEWDRGNNTYWHLSEFDRKRLSGEYPDVPRWVLTPEQRVSLIRIWGHQIEPYGVRGTCGLSVMEAVGATIEEIESVLGRHVTLTAPCDERERIV